MFAIRALECKCLHQFRKKIADISGDASIWPNLFLFWEEITHAMVVLKPHITDSVLPPESTKKKEILEIESTRDKIGRKIPWILGKGFRIPRFRTPNLSGKKFSIPTSPRLVIFLCSMIFLFWLSYGGIYFQIGMVDPTKTEMPAIGANSEGEAVWIYPKLHDSFIVEAIVSTMLLFTGAAGFYLIFYSTRHAIDRKYAVMVLIIGIGLILIGFLGLQKIIDMKWHPEKYD